MVIVTDYTLKKNNVGKLKVLLLGQVGLIANVKLHFSLILVIDRGYSFHIYAVPLKGTSRAPIQRFWYVIESS